MLWLDYNHNRRVLGTRHVFGRRPKTCRPHEAPRRTREKTSGTQGKEDQINVPFLLLRNLIRIVTWILWENSQKKRNGLVDNPIVLRLFRKQTDFVMYLVKNQSIISSLLTTSFTVNYTRGRGGRGDTGHYLGEVYHRQSRLRVTCLCCGPILCLV